jgi:hypothetical protein
VDPSVWTKAIFFGPLAPKTKAVLCEGAPDARAKGSVFVRMVSKSFFTTRASMCIVWHMKISIKDIMCDIKTINGVMYISDTDANRVLYPKTKRLSRGKSLSKESLCNTEDRNKMVKIGGVMYYPLDEKHIDDCYHNNVL